MSGTGGGGSRGGGTSGGGSPPDECGSLVVETTLNSPVPQVVKDLAQGSVLSVAIEISQTATRMKTLVAKDETGRTAGSLTPPDLITIIHCMEQGYGYEAVVLEKVVGGLVRVRIQPKA